MSINMSASTKFKAHAFRLAMFVILFAAATLLMAYALMSLVRAWPKVNVTLNLGDNVQDSGDDDNKKIAPKEDDTMYPGGSEVESGILDSLAQYDRYNDVLKRVSKDTGLGDRMVRQSMKDKKILSSDDDEWGRNFYATESDNSGPATITRDVTLFNL